MNEPHKIYWIDQVKNDPKYGKLRFKYLKSISGRIAITDEIADCVELDEFLQIEENRIPLLMGSQFGVFPKPEEIFKDDSEERIIGILGQSMLSGCVAGMFLYVFSNNKLGEKFYTFKNEDLLTGC